MALSGVHSSFPFRGGCARSTSVFAVNHELPKRRISSGERLTEVLRDHGGEIPGPRLSFRQRARPHPPEIRDAEPGDTDENGNREYRDEELGKALEGALPAR